MLVLAGAQNMIKVGNLAEISASFDNFVEGVKVDAKVRLQKIATNALSWMTVQSPQFSGDFAANWKVSINAQQPAGFILNAVGGSDWTDPRGKAFGATSSRRAGSPEAPLFALNAGLPIIKTAKLGDRVVISNSSYHDEFYSFLIEGNSIRFRPENLGKGNVIGRYMSAFAQTGFV